MFDVDNNKFSIIHVLGKKLKSMKFSHIMLNGKGQERFRILPDILKILPDMFISPKTLFVSK